MATKKATLPEEKKDAGEVKVVKRKSNGRNSPVIGNNGLMVDPGDNAKFLNVNMALFNMPDIDLHDIDAVEERLNEYFALYAANDMKPTVAGMAAALNGKSRQWLWALIHNQPSGGAGYSPNLPPNTANAIKKAYFLMENLWESYMNSGKINPVSGIFLGKNNFGYQDKQEYVVTPNTQQDSDFDADAIKQRYLIDSDKATLPEGE